MNRRDEDQPAARADRRRRGRPRGRAVLAFALALVALWPARARAQACCAGGSALTPGRLAPHEDALVGLQARAATVYATFDADGHYATPPPGAREVDLEQDLFGAVRFLTHGQAALLVPLVETWRHGQDVASPTGATSAGSELGGGVGDVNASARWDFTMAGDSKALPGIAALAGVTFPTGTPVESTGTPLGTGATGVGAFQGNVGLALEQIYGPWTFNLYGILAARAPRTANGVHTTLGPQLTAVAAGGYTFANEASAVLVLSYAVEGDATVDGQSAPGSARRSAQVSVAGLWPLADRWRIVGSAFFNPPVPGLGLNLPATVGLTLGAVRSWM